MELVSQLAKELGISVKYLTDDETEDIGLFKAMKDGCTGESVNVDDFIKKLRK